MRQHHGLLPPPLFSDQQEAVCYVDILDIQLGKGAGSKPGGSQQQDDDQVSKAHWRVGPIREVTNQTPVFILGKKLRHRFFDLGIGQAACDIFSNDPVKVKKW